MKQKHLFYAVLVLLIMNIFTLIGWSQSMNQVDAYHQYYMVTENFLDELDKHYDWVDAFDPEAYYDAVEKLKSNP